MFRKVDVHPSPVVIGSSTWSDGDSWHCVHWSEVHMSFDQCVWKLLIADVKPCAFNLKNAAFLMVPRITRARHLITLTIGTIRRLCLTHWEICFLTLQNCSTLYKACQDYKISSYNSKIVNSAYHDSKFCCHKSNTLYPIQQIILDCHSC